MKRFELRKIIKETIQEQSVQYAHPMDVDGLVTHFKSKIEKKSSKSSPSLGILLFLLLSNGISIEVHSFFLLLPAHSHNKPVTLWAACYYQMIIVKGASNTIKSFFFKSLL